MYLNIGRRLSFMWTKLPKLDNDLTGLDSSILNPFSVKYQDCIPSHVTLATTMVMTEPRHSEIQYLSKISINLNKFD